MCSDLSNLRNLGPVSVGWLREIGIENPGDLEAKGSVQVFLELRVAGLTRHLNMLYALEAALLDVPFTLLPMEVSQALREAVQE